MSQFPFHLPALRRTTSTELGVPTEVLQRSYIFHISRNLIIMITLGNKKNRKIVQDFPAELD